MFQTTTQFMYFHVRSVVEFHTLDSLDLSGGQKRTVFESSMLDPERYGDKNYRISKIHPNLRSTNLPRDSGLIDEIPRQVIQHILGFAKLEDLNGFSQHKDCHHSQLSMEMTGNDF